MKTVNNRYKQRAQNLTVKGLSTMTMTFTCIFLWDLLFSPNKKFTAIPLGTHCYFIYFYWEYKTEVYRLITHLKETPVFTSSPQLPFHLPFPVGILLL